MSKKHISPESRFQKFVPPGAPDACWEWTGKRNRHRYGVFMRSHVAGVTTTMLAHRFSWEIHNGPIPAGICVLHRCDNPPCTNPRHLFLGTRADNMADMVSKGRGAKGTANSDRAKLTEADIPKIRAGIAAGRTQRSIAKEFMIDPSIISEINSGKRWKHA